MPAAKELDEETHGRILRLSEAGDARMAARDPKAAIELFQGAFALVPEPYEEWDASLWLLAALGDAYFLDGQHEAARTAFAQAMRVPGAIGNPFLHLRVGEAQLERGDEGRAVDELLRAYMGAGEEIFADEDAKYLAFLRRNVDLQGP